MTRAVKDAIQKVLRALGYELRRTTSSTDPFEVQRELTRINDPVILDVGAHTGSVAKIYRDLFPIGYIYCFEPFPQSFQRLCENLKGDLRTFCHQTALAEREGTALLSANISSATNSLLMTDQRGASYWGDGRLDTVLRVEVTTTTVDAFCLQSGIPHVDILKMDVQGAEFSVLMGAKHLLSLQKVSLIYTELILCPTYVGQHKLHEYLALLDSLGYEFLDFFSPMRSGGQLIQADVVFLSSSFKERVHDRLQSARRGTAHSEGTRG